MTCETCPDTILCWQNLLHRRQCWYCKRWEVLFRDPLWDRLIEYYNADEAPFPAPFGYIRVRHCPIGVDASRRYNAVTSPGYSDNTICYECRRKHGYVQLGAKQYVTTYSYDD
jgi:hypothetical protein